MREKILEGAHSLFIQYGVRSVSMDDVAGAISVSKKTLYQHFKNKDDLVTEVVGKYLEGEMKEFDALSKSSSTAIEEMFNISKCLREHVDRINPSLLYDLQKYHAGAWAIFERFKYEFITGQIIDNLSRGIKDGSYRKDINPKIFARLRVEIIQLIFDGQKFPKEEFDFAEVHMQVFDHFVHGLLSEKGREQYQNYQLHEEK